MSFDTAMAAADERRATGPYAFPTAYQHEHEGMTLRDYFAGQAIEGLVYGLTPTDAKEAAISAYLIADAMLEQRKK